MCHNICSQIWISILKLLYSTKSTPVSTNSRAREQLYILLAYKQKLSISLFTGSYCVPSSVTSVYVCISLVQGPTLMKVQLKRRFFSLTVVICHQFPAIIKRIYKRYVNFALLTLVYKFTAKFNILISIFHAQPEKIFCANSITCDAVWMLSSFKILRMSKVDIWFGVSPFENVGKPDVNMLDFEDQ